MKPQQSKSNTSVILENKPQNPLNSLNQHEAFDKFGSQRIDGLKIISIENTTITPNGHIIAFYKGQKVLIPVRI